MRCEKMMKRLVVIFTSLVLVILLTLFYQLRFVSITGFIPSLKLWLHQRSSQHTYGEHPTFDERCYKYHKNLTAENKCCKMVNFSGSVGLIHKCIRSANDQLLRDERFHASEGADEGGGVVDVTEGGVASGGTEPARGQHWVIFGDSHMRYILVSFLTRLRSPSLEYRIPVDDKGWKSVAPAEKTLHNDKPFKNIEVRDLSVNLNITFYWDVHLMKHLPQEMIKWEQQPHHTPSLVLLGTALWWMKDNEAIYVNFGAKAAADLYEDYLRILRDRLSRLAKTTTVIFKLVDDVPRTRNPKSKTAFGVRNNFVLYNQLAVQELGNTGVIIWNSTVPLSLAYTKECTKNFRNTPPWYQWKCEDQGHVGYILVYQSNTTMPSDAKKKREQKKRDAAKAKQAGKKTETRDEKEPQENGSSNNSKKNSRETTPMTNGSTNGNEKLSAEEILCRKLEEDMKIASEARSCTGVLGIHPRARDIKIDNFSITFHGSEMLQDTKLELNCGRRYGLIGTNGCGKSTLLASLANREVPIQNHIDIFHLVREMPASDKTALQCVKEVDEERVRLEALAEDLASSDDDEAQEQLLDIYERLEELGADTAEAKAAFILHGLGFTHSMMEKKCRDFSGGWRMRIALARALFVKPHLLLLDEPTNHLDLDACVWLEEELAKYKRILVIISHSQDFLNGVCSNVIHMDKKKLKYFGGNYDAFVRTRLELLENQMKQYQWEQDQISHMKNYIARFGHGSAKLARQAQSKEKTLAKMVAGGLTERVSKDKSLTFSFPDCGTIPPPVIMVQNVSFRYTDSSPVIYKNLEFGIDLDTRLALVGPNGAGKSTLLKLLYGELNPTSGMIRKNSHLRIARYHQHLHELLDLDLSPIDYMMAQFPDLKERDEIRKIIGRYGLTGKQQVSPIRQLSDGQRCRVVFAWLAHQTPHLLLLDEPTNHLDMDTIDALGDAIRDFEGGLVLVSHDFRLISQVAQEIWICEKETVTKWQGDILAYKDMLKKKVLKENEKRKKMF